jgi:hypothetical protein
MSNQDSPDDQSQPVSLSDMVVNSYERPRAGPIARHISAQASLRVHEHIGEILAFAYSRKPVSRMIENSIPGGGKYLMKALWEIPRERADRALLELGLYMRMIDDTEDISSNHPAIFGPLYKTDGTTEALTIREATNKIIHAERYDWQLLEQPPSAICYASPDQASHFKWTKASINLIALAAFCSLLGS